MSKVVCHEDKEDDENDDDDDDDGNHGGDEDDINDTDEIKVFGRGPRGVKCVSDILTQVDCPRNRFLVKMLMTSPIMIAKRMRRRV